MSRYSKRSAGRALPLTLGFLALVFFLTFLRYRPPAAKPADAPAAEFSAGRARQVLWDLVGNGAPHPVGSDDHARVQKRVMERLTALGYLPQVQQGFACNEWGTCANVANILARLDGTAPGSALLLAAHYDSVPAGPGASDDGASVAAVLEIARALKESPQPKHPIILLVDDGEEPGLLGARAFVRDHPWAKEVVAAVNIDNRGSYGPSLMFETGSANAWLMQLYARAVPRPVTSSLFYFVYERLPNDTDFTVFKRAGYQGFNFASIGGVKHYHTPLDNFENAQPGSLQHHGVNALAALRALDSCDWRQIPLADSVFFDVFALATVHWRAQKTFLVTVILALVLLAEFSGLWWRARGAGRKFLWGIAGWVAVPVLAALIAFGLRWILRAVGALPVNWLAHSLVLQAAFWALAFGLAAGVGARVIPRAGFEGVWSGTVAWFALAALLTASLAPQASYPFVVPLGAAVLGGLPFAFGARKAAWARKFASIFPAGITAALLFGIAWLLYGALGAAALATLTAIIAIQAAWLIPAAAADQNPHLSLRFLRALSGIVAVASLLGVILLPANSRSLPERMSIAYLLDFERGNARWMVTPESRRLPDSFRRVLSFSEGLETPFPWSEHGFLADAPRLDLAPPALDLVSTEATRRGRRYAAMLRSQRGATDISIHFPPSSGVSGVAFQEQLVPPIDSRVVKYENGWSVYRCLAVPHDGVKVQFTLESANPVEVYVMDESYRLPTQLDSFRQNRPEWAVPSQDGDTARVVRKILLIP